MEQVGRGFDPNTEKAKLDFIRTLRSDHVKSRLIGLKTLTFDELVSNARVIEKQEHEIRTTRGKESTISLYKRRQIAIAAEKSKAEPTQSRYS